MSKSKYASFSVILLIIVIFVTACTQEVANTTTNSSNNDSFVIRDTDHVFGNPDAKITLFEYSDFECPYCKAFHATAEQIVNTFNGDVNWVFRHFPLDFHEPAATRESEATECAADQGGDEKFWEMGKLIYARTEGNGKGIDEDKLVDMSEEIGLDKDEFQKCLDSNKFKELIDFDSNEGLDLKVNGTPATFVYDRQTGEAHFISGNQSFDKLKGYLEGLLK